MRVVGHGIDARGFLPHTPATGTVRIVTVGRISATKRLAEMIEVMNVLHARGVLFSFTIVGAPVTRADAAYAVRLAEQVRTSTFASAVRVVGPVSHREVGAVLAEADVFLNLSATGSFDKAVLEAVLAGVTPVTSNEAYRELLTPYHLFATSVEPELLADMIVRARTADIQPLRALVAAQHSLSGLIERIESQLV